MRIVSVLALLIALFGGYTWVVLNWSYSTGERAGYVQKFSNKGWFCKTWEGEILLSSMPGAIPERFAFTVRDDAVVKQLQNAMGQRVQITYEMLAVDRAQTVLRYWNWSLSSALTPTLLRAIRDGEDDAVDPRAGRQQRVERRVVRHPLLRRPGHAGG
jgi:hypothetical protein